jgi:dGTP triphosphohydrolase
VYLGDQAQYDNAHARAVVRKIFDHLIEVGDPLQETVDYVAGMTDRFAFAYAAEL